MQRLVQDLPSQMEKANGCKVIWMYALCRPYGKAVWHSCVCTVMYLSQMELQEEGWVAVSILQMWVWSGCRCQWGYSSWLPAQHFGLLDQLSFHLCSQTAADKSWPPMCSRWWLNPQHGLTYQPSVHKAELIGSDPPERRSLELCWFLPEKCCDLAAPLLYVKRARQIFQWT